MKRIEVLHLEEDKPVVHYDSANGCDYTLCGDTLDECAQEPVETTKRVNCQRCLEIVRHVRGTHSAMAKGKQ